MSEINRNISKKRNSILDAAVETFQNEGYENASMDRIAQAANASKRTVYNHFESKEALFQAVVERFFEQIKPLKDIRYDSSRMLEDQLFDFATAKISLVENPTWLGLIRVTMGVFINDPQLGKATLEKAMEGEDSLVSWLIAAKEDGKLAFESAELAANVFWSLITGALFWPKLFEGACDPVEAQTLKKELIQVFLSRYRK